MSLEVVQFSSSGMTSYLSFIVTVVVSCTVCEILTFGLSGDVNAGVGITHLKCHHSITLVWFRI